MKQLSIDIETRSSIDIGKAGLYRYAQSDDFKILLFAYRFKDDAVQIVDLEQGEKIPDEVVAALKDPETVKHAYNAAFEWYCLNRAGYVTPLEQWRCTMIHGLYCGYTAGLDRCLTPCQYSRFPDLNCPHQSVDNRLQSGLPK